MVVMHDRCILCDHPTLAHDESGCHRISFLTGSCDCDFLEPTALPSSATAEQHLDRAAWWAHRIDLADHRSWHVTHGTEQWRRLDRFRRLADETRRQHIRIAREIPRDPTPDQAAGAEDDRDDLFDLISIESIERQPAAALDALLELFDQGSTEGRDVVRLRLEVGFEALEPRHRRALLEDDAIRGALVHMGVLSPWGPAGAPEGAREAVPGEPAGPSAIERAMGATLGGSCFQDELAHQFDGSIGDMCWSLTTAASDRRSHDERLLSTCREMREVVESYWRHWAQAPDPAVQRSLIVKDPDSFRRQMLLAIRSLTPPEKARFEGRTQLFGWVASGMLPLFVDEEPVPLEDIIEARYLTSLDS
jgi:hypothetical protein